MIIKAVEEFAQALCEVSPSGGCDGVQILLPEKQWRALEMEMLSRVAQSRMYLAPQESEPAQPGCVRIYTQGGAVTIRRAP